MNCWLCNVDITEENTAGTRKGKLKSVCKECHSIYNAFLILSQISKEEVSRKLDKISRSKAIHEDVLQSRGETPVELAKAYINNAKRSKNDLLLTNASSELLCEDHY